jgi:hypothetical protein
MMRLRQRPFSPSGLAVSAGLLLGIVKLKAEPLMWPQDVGVISLPERQVLGRDGPNSRQLDNAPHAERLTHSIACSYATFCHSFAKNDASC